MKDRVFTDEQIEQLVEDELRKADLYPTARSPTVDLERLVQNLGAQLERIELEKTLLGGIEFDFGRPPRIMINSLLTDGYPAVPAANHRWRDALSHEASHLILHRGVLEFGSDDVHLRGDPVRLRCGVGRRMSSLMRAAEATCARRGMAAILMPQAFLAQLIQTASKLGTRTPRFGTSADRGTIASLAAQLQVSRKPFGPV